MESFNKSLNSGLSAQEVQFRKYATHMLEISKPGSIIDTLDSPDLSEFEAAFSPPHQTSTSDFLKRLGATFIHSIQLQSLPRANTPDSPQAPLASPSVNDMEFTPHHLVMNTHHYNSAMDELQKQLDYDKFMNEVWIGVVLTLILISMIFCFCSCFLYHQFRVWKRNYHTTVVQPSDVEAVKLNLDTEDPVPEYTLVSGLPSYEAALELLHKTQQTCLILHPSVFEVFNKNEKSGNEHSALTEGSPTNEVATPLLSDNKSTLPGYSQATSITSSSPPVGLPTNHSFASLLSLAAQMTSPCKPKALEAEKPCKA